MIQKIKDTKMRPKLAFALLSLLLCNLGTVCSLQLKTKTKSSLVRNGLLGNKLVSSDLSENAPSFKEQQSRLPMKSDGKSLSLPWTLYAVTAFTFVDQAVAKTPNIDMSKLTPQTFQPVCPASDGLYRFLQGTTESIVGKESFVEYSPLIAGGLLRVRLELCVVESFFNEAVGPFIKQNGISWILPLHETVETFLAGTIFALATTFILVGSTKLVTILITYADFFVGIPCRTFGGFAFDRARGKPVTLDIGFGPFKTRIIGPKDLDDDGSAGEDVSLDLGDNPALTVVTGGVKSIGEASKVTREIVEAIDLFVGRYLVLYATGYIALKFVHFKIFPDFP
mmetsp:Transcript_11383/g.17472  ORF Transcript_11383/g.17472 Transcript_11383/m.17472 type:complete len:339 (+) Transcript_11383:73-1089(+)